MATRHKPKTAGRAGKSRVKKPSAGKVTHKAGSPSKFGKLTIPRPPTPAVSSSRLTEPIPDETAIQKLLSNLDSADRVVAVSILEVLEEHFGSSDAARVWLATKSPEFGTTPLEAIRGGKARLVQAVLDARWGPNPTYA